MAINGTLKHEGAYEKESIGLDADRTHDRGGDHWHFGSDRTARRSRRHGESAGDVSVGGNHPGKTKVEIQVNEGLEAALDAPGQIGLAAATPRGSAVAVDVATNGVGSVECTLLGNPDVTGETLTLARDADGLWSCTTSLTKDIPKGCATASSHVQLPRSSPTRECAALVQGRCGGPVRCLPPGLKARRLARETPLRRSDHPRLPRRTTVSNPFTVLDGRRCKNPASCRHRIHCAMSETNGHGRNAPSY